MPSAVAGVTVSGVTFAYRRQPIVAELSHQFPPGAVSAITGPSGGGKSTLLYLIGLLLRPQRGSIAIDGREVDVESDTARSRARSSAIGFVFQDAMLDPSRTVLANVMEGAVYTGMRRGERRRRAWELLAALGIDHRADHRPGEISGGQAQRVALCRALIKHPSVVLADEPTGNLDAASAEVVWELLARQASGGATVIVATHDRERAAACDELLDLGMPS